MESTWGHVTSLTTPVVQLARSQNFNDILSKSRTTTWDKCAVELKVNQFPFLKWPIRQLPVLDSLTETE